MKKINEFDIGTTAEFREAGMNANNWKSPEINPANVPENLQDLIPLVRRFGVPCDVTRHDIAEHATKEELAEVSTKMRGRQNEIEDFLFSFGIGANHKPWSDEAYHFNALVKFAEEECDFQGTSGILAYSIRKYREEPSQENINRLHAAYQSTEYWSAFLREFNSRELEQIREILNKHSDNHPGV